MQRTFYPEAGLQGLQQTINYTAKLHIETILEGFMPHLHKNKFRETDTRQVINEKIQLDVTTSASLVQKSSDPIVLELAQFLNECL